MVRLSAVAATFGSLTIEGKGLTMSFRDLAKGVSRSAMNKHRSHVKAGLQKRRRELKAALAAVEEGLRHLSGPKRPAKKR
jgi:hypothetical protein